MAENSNVSKITITSDTGESIELTSTNTKITFDTFAENVRNKSKSMNVTVTIKGKIKDTDTDKLMKLFKWSKTYKSAEVYRKLVIEDTIGTDEVQRTYEFPQMFVLGYEENLDEDDANSNYALTLRQKEDHFDDIETY